MACVYKRANGFYYLRYLRDGKWRWRSLKVKSKRAAEKEAEKILAGTRPAPVKASSASDLTFEQLKANYLTWAEHNQSLKTRTNRLWALGMLDDFCAPERVADVTVADLERFKTERKGRSGKVLRPQTVNEVIGVLKALVNRARRQKWYAGPNVFSEVDPLPTIQKQGLWLDKAGIAAILEKAELHSTDMYLFCALGVYAGLRKLEIINARWEWIDFEAGLFRVLDSEDFRTKTRKSRTVPLHDALRKILEGHLRKDGFIVAPFKRQGQHVYRYDQRKTFKAVAAAAGVPWCTPHTLRHTFASQLVSAGVSLFKVSAWLGHTSMRTTMIYSHLAPADTDINRF